jgi:predicted Ser/Thr protein kinase
VKEVEKIAKKAAKLKIGPELYDLFVTENEEQQVVIVKIFELINGKTWSATEWKSLAAKQKSVKHLEEIIHTMNKAGIIHHDLHSDNVMIHKSGKLYIIDYDRASIVDTEEKGRLSAFNNTIPNEWAMTGAMSDNGLFYIYTKLVEEGTIRFSPIQNKTRKNRR